MAMKMGEVDSHKPTMSKKISIVVVVGGGGAVVTKT
jgi:hypothetical protein